MPSKRLGSISYLQFNAWGENWLTAQVKRLTLPLGRTVPFWKDCETGAYGGAMKT
jgi:hypothetical protein